MKNRDTKEEVYKVFQLFDEDGQDRITFKNLKKMAEEVGEVLEDHEIHEMI
eukprot:CAMPEP_0116885382 /NCGR_PEP_ID=MMETSP0463-20121206/18697_1 /TAXON_ID=181622 /ORGANISM="Strombidinopsis sp, Strain SopsisLIS2011" /LENGTH=50 /DNA_ID=CAMNT_0004543677 /DNA_START=310 /DNA_END=462 /DNA_ORIENTATION=+